jgi:hypothetical protein
MEKAIWGGNRLVVIQSIRLRADRGKLEDSTDAPMAAALIEVLHRPEAAIRNQRPDLVGQRRLAFCRRDKTGRFSFLLPDRDYEIRARKSEGFDVPSVLIEGRKSAPNSSKPLTVARQFGEQRRIPRFAHRQMPGCSSNSRIPPFTVRTEIGPPPPWPSLP